MSVLYVRNDIPWITLFVMFQIRNGAIALTEIKFCLMGLSPCTLSLIVFVPFIDSCNFQEVSDGQMKVTRNYSSAVACDCVRTLVK